MHIIIMPVNYVRLVMGIVSLLVAFIAVSPLTSTLEIPGITLGSSSITLEIPYWNWVLFINPGAYLIAAALFGVLGLFLIGTCYQ
jgi:hypothetical protein